MPVKEHRELIGTFIGADWDNYVISSKYGIGVTRTEPWTVRGNSRKAMFAAVEGSLRRLGTDYLDLYSPHGVDASTPLEEILAGLDDLVRAGKVRYTGLGAYPAWQVSRAALLADIRNYVPLTTIRFEYSLAERSADRELLPMAEALGLGVLIWSPLAGGYLAGPPPRRSKLPHWAAGDRPGPRDAAILDAVVAVAGELDAQPGQVALGWLRQHFASSATTVVPVIGASTGRHLDDALAALTLPLTSQQLAALDSVSAPELGQPHEYNRLSLGLLEPPAS
jgi:aryl-alcohol dehydrogenase-like predicted oxidoreductase